MEQKQRVAQWTSFLAMLCLGVREYVVAKHSTPHIATPRGALTFAASGLTRVSPGSHGATDTSGPGAPWCSGVS